MPSCGKTCSNSRRSTGPSAAPHFSEDEMADINRDDLIAEEPMVVTLSQRGYVKRTPLSTYQAQNRGGKGITGVKSDEEDDIKHLFVASTHAYLLVLYRSGPRALAKGVRSAAAKPHESRAGDRQSAVAEGRGRTRDELPGGPRIHRRAVLDHGDQERHGEEDGPLGLQPADEGGHYRHQARRGGRADRRADRLGRRRRRAGDAKRHVDPVFASRRPANGPGDARRPRHQPLRGRRGRRPGRGRSADDAA